MWHLRQLPRNSKKSETNKASEVVGIGSLLFFEVLRDGEVVRAMGAIRSLSIILLDPAKPKHLIFLRHLDEMP